MPFAFGGTGTGGGGGGGLHFRNPVDVFADAAARTTAFSSGGTLEGEHVQFAADPSLAIVIGTIANPTNFQTYTGDSGAYDDSLWLDRTDAVQGFPGAAGMDGAPGGGAWDSLGTYDHTAADHGANVFVSSGITLPMNRRVVGVRLGGDQDAIDENGGIVPLSVGLLESKSAASAGDTSTDASRIRVSEYGGGGFLTGNLYMGLTSSREILYATSNANQDFYTEIFDYVPSAAQGGRTDAEIQALIDATSLSALQGMVTDGQIPAAIMRDAEFTAAAVRSLLGLTATEVNDLLTGASITNRVLTFTQNDGTDVTINLPADSDTQDGVVSSGAINAAGTELTLTLDTGGTVVIDIPAVLRATGGMADGVIDDTSFDASTYMASLMRTIGADVNLDLSPILTTINALTARVAALEGGVTPHSLTRYAALRASGSTPGDFTAADFLGANATSSMTQDITTPASGDNMVVGVAVPVSEGVLTQVAELTEDGSVNQFANMIRGDFLPTSTDVSDQVTLNIDGDDHYIYCTDAAVRSVFLGVIGYRLTQG